jgi:hypothetical protein
VKTKGRVIYAEGMCDKYDEIWVELTHFTAPSYSVYDHYLLRWGDGKAVNGVSEFFEADEESAAIRCVIAKYDELTGGKPVSGVLTEQMPVPDNTVCVTVPTEDYEALRLDADYWQRFKTLEWPAYVMRAHTGIGGWWGKRSLDCGKIFDTAEAALDYALGEREKME